MQFQAETKTETMSRKKYGIKKRKNPKYPSFLPPLLPALLTYAADVDPVFISPCGFASPALQSWVFAGGHVSPTDA